MKNKLVGITLVACTLLTVAQNPDMNKIKQEKQNAQKEMNATAQKLQQKKNETRRSLNNLNRITAEIGEQQRAIGELQKQIAEIDIKIKGVNDQIAVQNAALEKLRANYLKAIQKIRAHHVAGNDLMFLFSSETFHQAYQRMRYLKEYAQWRKGQTEQIKKAMAELEKQKQQLQALQEEKNKTISEINNNRLTLEGKKTQQTQMIADLKAESGELQLMLEEQQRKYRELDNKLSQLIEQQQREEEERRRIAEEKRKAEEAERLRKEEEARKAEEARLKAEEEKRARKLEKIKREQEKEAEKQRKEELKKQQEELERQQKELKKQQEKLEKERQESLKRERERQESMSQEEQDQYELSGNFENNKGKLPSPVSGSFRIVKPFGKHKHPVLEYVTTDNPGVEIETDAGAQVRSVFKGEISYIYQVNNEYNYVIIVKHGQYMTVYAGLKTISVKKGDKVNAGQTLGTLFVDANDEAHSILHFQVRKGTTKLDPAQWLK